MGVMAYLLYPNGRELKSIYYCWSLFGITIRFEQFVGSVLVGQSTHVNLTDIQGYENQYFYKRFA
jgi:hypothetical protein